MAGEQLEFGFDVPSVAPTSPNPAKPPRRPSIPAPARKQPVARTTVSVTETAKPAPFHYTNSMWPVVRDLVATLPELRHIDLDRVTLSIAQARQQSKHGVYASCVPLRFEGGEQETQVGKRRFRMQTFVHEGREILYIIYFMLPRFHEEQDYREKLATVIHELYHISPQFDGDIRRFPGKNFAHGHSRDVYHAAMRKLADQYLLTSTKAHRHEFLKVPFQELLQHPGGIIGTSVPKPRAVLIDPPPSRRKR